MIRLERYREGVVLPVRATAGARRAGIGGEHGGALKVSVTEPAEKGKANKAIQAALCKVLGVRSDKIELLSGAAARQKRFLIRGVSLEVLTTRLVTILDAER
jgi:hypothetical protein